MEWKVEELKLRNARRENGTFECEDSLSDEEKIAFVDKFQNGKMTILLNIFEKFKDDYDGIKKNKYGTIYPASLLAWIRRNNQGNLMDEKYSPGHIWLLGCRRGNIVYTSFQNEKERKLLINDIFHDQLLECKKQEDKYFLAHDEYSILKEKLSDYRCKFRTTFGVHLSFWSSGGIAVVGDDDEESRDITIDELKLLLGKYELLEKYEAELSEDVNIVF